ncbi:MAG: glycosyltransferase [Candidatus Bathyarchaeia archaeon]
MDLSIITMLSGVLVTAVGLFWAFYAVAGVLLKTKPLKDPIGIKQKLSIVFPATLVLKPKNLGTLKISISIPTTFMLELRTLEHPRFSILIPARNEERVIENILGDLLAQTYENFEVFVVCHNCTDGTFGKAEEYAKRDQRIRPLLLSGKEGKAVALNYGAKHATGDIIVVFDADNRVPPNSLGKVLKYFPKYDAVQSRIEASNADFSLISKLADLEIAVFSEMFQKTRHALGINVGLGGTGEFIRREVLEKVGCWDNSLTEDFALFAKLTRHNYKIGWAHDITIYDEKTPFAYSMLKQRARWLRGHFDVMLNNLRYFHKDPLNFHYLIAPLAVMGYYVVYFLWILMVLGVPVNAWYIPLWVWLLPSATFYTGIVAQIVKARKVSDLIYIPLLLLYLYHWQVAFIGMFMVKNWNNAKTQHGFR